MKKGEKRSKADFDQLLKIDISRLYEKAKTDEYGQI
jgi:hypothetical protein